MCAHGGFTSDGSAPEGAHQSGPAPKVWGAQESQFEFLSRRALEESRLAAEASTAEAAAAHRYLAAAYSAELAKEVATAAALEELLLGLS